MTFRPQRFKTLPTVVVFLVMMPLAAQETPNVAVSNPATPSIPAIPGIPASGQERASRPSPAFPTQPGPGVAMPGFSIPGLAGPVSAKPEPIRPEFSPGNTYRFVVKTELQTGSGDGFTMEHQARFDAKVRIDGTPGIILKARSERLDLTLSSRGTTVSYQSLNSGDQETPLGRHVRASLNRSVDLTLDEKGRIDTSQEGGKGDESALLPGVPRFGPEELAQLVTSLSQGFTEKRVGPGEQWSLQGSRAVGEFGLATFDITYRHAGSVNFEGQNCLSIEFAGTLGGLLPEVSEAGQPVDFQATSLRGRIYFDPLDRMVRYSDQSIDLWITRPASGTDPGGPMAVRQATTVRLLHVVPTP